jgi:predicted nucleic acid-binding protein
MIVVSDTSPLTALLTINEAELLTNLFGEVVIPPAVHLELLRTHPVLPNWLRVQALRDLAKTHIYSQNVDRGEAEAIALAEELRADHLLIDERKGRRLPTARPASFGIVGSGFDCQTRAPYPIRSSIARSIGS